MFPTREEATRLLPVRKNPHTSNRKHSCTRRWLVRQWLAAELQNVPTAAITGEVRDLMLNELQASPTPFLREWMARGASAEALTAALHPVGVTAQSIHQLRVSAGQGWLTDTLQAFAERTSRLFHDPALTHIGLYIAEPGHIFATLVTKAGHVITDIAIMDTVVYPRGYTDPTTYETRFYIVEAIMRAAPTVNTFQNLWSACHFMHSTREIAGPRNLQIGEDKFCQHWDTFFLYHTMVKGYSPEYVFQEVLHMDPRARLDMIRNFTNQVAEAAQVMSHTWSDATTSVPVHTPLVERIMSTEVYD